MKNNNKYSNTRVSHAEKPNKYTIISTLSVFLYILSILTVNISDSICEILREYSHLWVRVQQRVIFSEFTAQQRTLKSNTHF